MSKRTRHAQKVRTRQLVIASMNTDATRHVVSELSDARKPYLHISVKRIIDRLEQRVGRSDELDELRKRSPDVMFIVPLKDGAA